MALVPVKANHGETSRTETTENMYTHKNQRLKITQLEKAHFIKVNELKLTEVKLF